MSKRKRRREQLAYLIDWMIAFTGSLLIYCGAIAIIFLFIYLAVT